MTHTPSWPAGNLPNSPSPNRPPTHDLIPRAYTPARSSPSGSRSTETGRERHSTVNRDLGGRRNTAWGRAGNGRGDWTGIGASEEAGLRDANMRRRSLLGIEPDANSDICGRKYGDDTMDLARGTRRDPDQGRKVSQGQGDQDDVRRAQNVQAMRIDDLARQSASSGSDHRS